MSVIRGKNAILYFSIDGLFKPVGCMESWSLTTTADIKETSTVQTGTTRTYRYNRNTYTISCQGICSFDENHSHVKVRQLQQGFVVVPISIVEIDDNAVQSTFMGNVLITTVTNNAAANDFDSYTIEATGNGNYTLTDIPVDPNECCQDAWYYYTGTGSEGSSVTIPALVGRTIAGRLYRDGVEFRPSGAEHDGSGVPVGKQFKFEPASGRISFDTSLVSIGSGEPIDIPYNICTVVTGCNIIASNVSVTFNNGDSKFHITFTPEVGGTPTVPEGVTVRYSTDNGSTWTSVVSLTYDPNTNYQLIVINDTLDGAGSYVFEVTPQCNGVNGTAGTGSYNACIDVTIGSVSLPDAYVPDAYDFNVALNGTAPFTITNIVKPAWMTVAIVGSNVHLSGTPASGDVGTGITVSFTVHNCAGASFPYSDTIDVKEGVRWVNITFVSGDTVTDHETVQLQGEAGAVVVFTLDNYTNSNGGTLTVDAIPVTGLGETFTYTLDGSGLSSVIAINIDGLSAHPGSVILGRFTITSTSIGQIGSPFVFQTSKIF